MGRKKKKKVSFGAFHAGASSETKGKKDNRRSKFFEGPAPSSDIDRFSLPDTVRIESVTHSSWVPNATKYYILTIETISKRKHLEVTWPEWELGEIYMDTTLIFKDAIKPFQTAGLAIKEKTGEKTQLKFSLFEKEKEEKKKFDFEKEKEKKNYGTLLAHFFVDDNTIVCDGTTYTIDANQINSYAFPGWLSYSCSNQ